MSASGVASAAPTLYVLGECPGEVTLRVMDLDAYATVTVIYGEAAPGSGLAVPRGPCAGVETDLATGRRGFDLTDTDGIGMLSFTTEVIASRCGTAFHLLDVETCEISNLGVVPEPELTTTPDSSSYWPYYSTSWGSDTLYEYLYGTSTSTSTSTTTSSRSWAYDYYYGASTSYWSYDYLYGGSYWTTYAYW